MINTDPIFIMMINYVYSNPITFTMLGSLSSAWLKILAARHPEIDDNKIRTLIKSLFFRRA